MSKLQQIKEGWLNYIFDNPEVKELAEKRAEICASCDENIANFCKICGCFLPSKTRSVNSKCPKMLW